MVVVLDIGNTNIHVGLFKEEILVKNTMYPLSGKSIADKILNIVKGQRISGVAIASVVPRLTTQLTKFFKRRLAISPLVVSSKHNCHLTFDYYKPKTLGADRIANVVGGLARYRRDLIIIDFGTATTLDIVLKNGRYLGGIITPGFDIITEALARRTALLKKVSLRKPSYIIGKSTEECIQSGIFNGTAAMINGLIQKIKKKYKKNFLCIATGGWGKTMTPQIQHITYYDPHLCLYGTLKIYYYNAS